METDSGTNKHTSCKETGCGEFAPASHSYWPKLFFLLNAIGLAAIFAFIWILHAPLGELLLVRFDPQGEISPGDAGKVTVEFGTLLRPETVGQDALQLSPPVPGHLEFVEERILQYVLEKPLARATRYRICLSPGLRGLRGERAQERILEFTTPALAVRSIRQAGIGGNTAAIAIEFNSEVNPEELRDHLKLRYRDDSPLDFILAGGKPENVLLLQVQQVTQDAVLLTLNKGLTGIEGPLGLADDYKAELRIATFSESAEEPASPDTHLVTITPKVRFLGMEAEQYGEKPIINIKMNTPLDASQSREYVKIEPDVPHNFEAWRSGLRLAGEFQAGKRYRVTLKTGLPAGAAGALVGEISRVVWFPDMRESMRFAFGGGYLSPQGLLTVPIRTVNMREGELSVCKLYASNVVEHVLDGEERLPQNISADILTRKIAFANRPNEEVETLLNLRELADNTPRGVYCLNLRNRERYWRSDTAVIVVTDLGLSARVSETQALCWVTSLATAEPRAGVTVRLFSDRRQEIGQAITGENGLVEIIIPKLPAGEEPAMLLASLGEDLSYLGFSRNALARGREACQGRPYLQNGYEVFVSTERGVYRPGDEVRVSAFVRGAGLNTPPQLPLDLVVERPDGREFSRRRIFCGDNGRLLGEVAIPMSAPSGYYPVSFRLPGKKETLGETGFRVADYIPQTLRMTLAAPTEPLPAGRSYLIKAQVRHLFGDPAQGLKIKGKVRYSSTDFSPRDWKGFSFGDERKTGSTRNVSLAEKTLDATGDAEFEIMPPSLDTPAAINMTAEIEVLEAGGRAITEQLTRRLDPWLFYLGLKLADAAIHPRETAPFDLVAVAPDGKAHAPQVSWQATLYAVTYSNVLRRLDDGRLTYDWTRKESEESRLRGTFAGGGAQIQLAPQSPGPYRLVVEAEGGCAVTRDFYVTGAGGNWLAHDPDQLQLTLDQRRYRVESEAVCTIQAPFAGTALVCVEGDRVSEKRLVRLQEGNNPLHFSVREEWRPNVYITATLIRPVKPEEDWRPHRASGLTRLVVDCADHRLAVSIDAPERAKPALPLTVRVQVNSALGKPVRNAAVILAAVDEGVLALTDYNPASPFDFFHALRRLEVREIDMYSRLAPELSRWRAGKEPEPGGGEGKLPDLARQLNPISAKRVKTVALYEGHLVTDDTGSASVEFTLPEYLGELRLMAFAASGKSFGLGEKPLSVRSPVMFRASWPRFLAPGDAFEVPVTLFNRSDKNGAIELRLELDEHLLLENLPAPVFVKAGEEATARLRLKAVSIGKTTARLQIKLNGEEYAESVEMPVRPAVAFARSSGFETIPAGEEKTVKLAGEFISHTGKASVVVTGNPLAEVAGSLQYLLAYPYGCLEQTTSRLVPLLYAHDLAAMVQPDTIGREESANLLDAGFLRLEMMQTYNGGLAMWPGGREPYDWGTLYACDMLTEAKKAAYDIPERLYDGAVSYVERRLEYWTTFRRNGKPTRLAEAAYGCYVLTRAGRRPQAWLARIDELVRIGDKSSWRVPASARCHLAAAYLLCGEREAARQFLQAASTFPQQRVISGSLSSSARDAAIMLMTLLDVEPDSERIPKLVRGLRTKLNNSYWGTTQENAFALMALGKYARRLPFDPEGTVTVILPDGKNKTAPVAQGLSLSTLLPGESIRVKAEGKSQVYIYWNTEGVPVDGGVQEKDSGLSIRRSVCDPEGNEIDDKSLKQGKLYQIALSVHSERAVENGVIVSLLPAGLELENQDLRGTATLAGTRWPAGVNAQRLNPLHAEPRDDRLLVFADFPAGSSEYRYLVRAVTAGTFAWPAVEASCMYDPDVYSVHGKSNLQIGE
jgi:uncharacterized protein YfaS (alpha-2-macroglobulin family)